MVKKISASGKSIRCLETMWSAEQNFDMLLLTGGEDSLIRVYLTSHKFALIQKIRVTHGSKVRGLAPIPFMAETPNGKVGVLALCELKEESRDGTQGEQGQVRGDPKGEEEKEKMGSKVQSGSAWEIVVYDSGI